MDSTLSKRSIEETEEHLKDDSRKKLCKENEVAVAGEDESAVTFQYAKCLKECDVGIVEYIHPGKGFFGILKQRHSDFIVHEIDESGNIVHLTENDKANDTADSNILDDKTLESVEALLDEKITEFNIQVDGKDKEERMLIHKAIKKKSPKLETETKEVENVKCIVVKLKSTQKSGRKLSRGVNVPFVHIVLYKENMDTMEAIFKLSLALRKKAQCFTYAGVKDKRAKTSQKVCVKKCSINDLAAIGNRFSNLHIGNFEKRDTALHLGQLKGNQFKIALREVKGCQNNIAESIKSLFSLGFINYFGMQRFGTTTIPTHRVGKAIVAKNFKEAVELILKPRQGDKEHMNEARKVWWSSRNHQLALKALKLANCLEGKLLKGLCAMKNENYLSALEYLPRNTLMMYIHSFQSYIWNLMVSKRLQLFGLKVQVGDLVSNRAGKDVPDSSEVIEVTEDNLKEYTIYDVVLPLPGYSTRIPENMKKYYDDLLAEDGLDMQCFKKKNESKWMSLSGAYRPLVTLPKDTSWKIVHYDDPFESLILSDLDVIQGKSCTHKETGRKMAVILEFSLPSSVYASMAIRELTRLDTSSAYQRTLNAN